MKRITLVKRKLSITYDIKWKEISFTLKAHTHRDKMENIDVKLHSQKECERNSTLSGKWQLQNFIG